MNNKLFARIAAAAVGVSMLSTFVFADTAVPTIAEGELSFMNGETNIIAATVKDNAAYVTMMSYLISAEEKAAFDTNGTIPTPADTNIIALDQVGLDSLSQLNSVKLLASKLDGTNPAAVVRTGDSNGGGNTWVIALAEDGKSYTITFIAGMGKIGEASTATNTTAADGTVTPVANPETGKAGLTFQYWATKDATGAYTKFDPTTTKVTADTELYAVYQIKVGDINLDGTVDYADTDGMAYYYISGRGSAAKKEAFKKIYPNCYFESSTENYFVDLNGNNVYIGDINKSGSSDYADTDGMAYYYISGRGSAAKKEAFKAIYNTCDFEQTPVYVVTK